MIYVALIMGNIRNRGRKKVHPARSRRARSQRLRRLHSCPPAGTFDRLSKSPCTSTSVSSGREECVNFPMKPANDCQDGFKILCTPKNIDEKEEWFKHDFFIRDRPDLLKMVKRCDPQEKQACLQSSVPSVPRFLQKMWDLVENEQYDDLIYWSSDGRSFVIPDKNLFKEKLMPLFFNCSLMSFQRQLNSYGFRKLKTACMSGLTWHFHHKCFIRGRQDLLKLIEPNRWQSKSGVTLTSTDNEAAQASPVFEQQMTEVDMNLEPGDPESESLESGSLEPGNEEPESLEPSRVCQETSSSENNGICTFVRKLWGLLEIPENNDMISWSKDGTSFVIKKKFLFEQRLLPLVFKCNLHGFVRQLNAFGFRKLISLENSTDDEWTYRHPWFIRGNVESLSLISKKTADQIKKTQQDPAGQMSPFIQKLWKVVNSDKYTEIVHWSEDGMSFIIEDPDRFEQKVIPAHFRCHFSSFVRQLNNYDFSRLDPNSSGGSNCNIKQQYEHPYFIKGRMDLLKLVKRKTSHQRTIGNSRYRFHGSTAFVHKLWKLVDSPEYDDVISWAPEGRSFIIQNAGVFERTVLRPNFQARFVSSFVRILSIYGFKKMKGKTEYGHPCFIRGKKKLLKFIKKKKCSKIPCKAALMLEAPEHILPDVVQPVSSEAQEYQTMSLSLANIKEEPLEMTEMVVNTKSPDVCPICNEDKGCSAQLEQNKLATEGDKRSEPPEIRNSTVWSSFDVFPFINMLYNTLNTPKYFDVISWNEKGDGFIIWHENLLIQRLFPGDSAVKYRRFRSMLRNFGFKKSRNIVNGVEVQYHHPSFLREREDLLVLVCPVKTLPLNSRVNPTKAFPKDINSLIGLYGTAVQHGAEDSTVSDSEDEISEEEFYIGEGVASRKTVPVSPALGLKSDIDSFDRAFRKNCQTEKLTMEAVLSSVQKMQENIKSFFMAMRNEYEFFMAELSALDCRSQSAMIKATNSESEESFPTVPVLQSAVSKCLQAIQNNIRKLLDDMRKEIDLILVKVLQRELKKSTQVYGEDANRFSATGTLQQYLSLIQEVQSKVYSSILKLRELNGHLWQHLRVLSYRNDEPQQVLLVHNEARQKNALENSECANPASAKEKDLSMYNLLSNIINQLVVLHGELTMMQHSEEIYDYQMTIKAVDTDGGDPFRIVPEYSW